MCNPVAAVGYGLMVAAPVIGGIQEAQQYKQAKAQAKAQAYDLQQEYELRKQDRARERARIVAAARARAGAAGFAPDVGSPLDVQMETARNFARDQFLDEYETTRQIKALKRSAKNYGTSANNAVAGGFLNAGATLGSYMIKG